MQWRVYRIPTLIALDVANVGTSDPSGTIRLCREFIEALGNPPAARPNLISGGGLCTVEDCQTLFDAGCDKALVVTGLLPKPSTG
jgi:uncharacterized protein related to proFAR isomerase